MLSHIYKRVIIPLVRLACLTTIITPSFYFIFKQNHYITTRRFTSLPSAANLYGPDLAQSNADRILRRTFAPMLKFERFALIKNRVLIVLYALNLFKYSLLILLDLDFMANYRLLDCFIIGRLAFLGRSSVAAKYLGFMVTLFFFIYRSLLIVLKPPFCFDCTQFILNGQEMALRNETKSLDMRSDPLVDAPKLPAGRSSTMRRKQAYSSYQRNSFKKDDSRLDAHSTSPAPTRSISGDKQQDNTPDYDPCYFTPNYFDMSNDLFHNNLRPNRTLESWRELCLYIFLLTITFSIYYLSITLTVYRTIGPTVVTNIGFKLNYHNCYQRLTELKRKHNIEYSWLFKVSNTTTQPSLTDLPFFLPLDELIEPTVYGICRLLLDTFENHFMYYDFLYTLAAHTQLNFHIVFDMYINYKSIRRRLIEIAYHQMALREAASHRQLAEQSAELLAVAAPRVESDDLEPKGRKSLSGNGGDCSSLARRSMALSRNQLLMAKELESTVTIYERLCNWLFGDSLGRQNPITRANCELEIVRIQTILVDHFMMISKYNRYIEFHIKACMLLWSSYTILLCLWLSISGSEPVALEFYVAFLVSFVLVIFLLTGPAGLDACNLKLYKWIVSIMAQDANFVSTKGRWINIVKYYYPAPLYCFSLFRLTRISWLFCLKIYSWVLTAILVVGSFLMTYKADTFRIAT